MKKRLSIQWHIFRTMMLIVLASSLLMIGMTVFQYRQQAVDYHIKRLNRKENAIKREIKHILQNTTWNINSKNLKYIFKEEIYMLSDVHAMELNMYDLQGNLLISSRVNIVKEKGFGEKKLPRKIIEILKNNIPEHRIIKEIKEHNLHYKISYSYINDLKGNPIGILALPYVEESKFFQHELKEFLHRIILLSILVLIVTGIIAYFLSKYISGTIQQVAEKIRQTRLQGENEKIVIEQGSKEIYQLVSAYNEMIDELEESAGKLARSEREFAWREMAKQVAHEIKNPLTPMRLTIQSYQRKIEKGEIPTKEEMKEISSSIIQQIDLMTSIATAFSDFAKMPVAKAEKVNIVEVIRKNVELYAESYIRFSSEEDTIGMTIDKSQLIRVITNLVTNARQAVSQKKDPLIEVKIEKKDGFIYIYVIDNGKGIPDDIKDKIFEPKFTTKSKGMGLGLAMVKNIVETYGGQISFTSQVELGTVFMIRFPLS